MACVFDETAQVAAAAAAAAAQAQDEDHHQQAAEAAAAIGSSSVGAVHSIGSGGHFVIWVEATLLLSLRVLLFRGHYGLITEYTDTYVAHRREHFAEAIAEVLSAITDEDFGRSGKAMALYAVSMSCYAFAYSADASFGPPLLLGHSGYNIDINRGLAADVFSGGHGGGGGGGGTCGGGGGGGGFVLRPYSWDMTVTLALYSSLLAVCPLVLGASRRYLPHVLSDTIRSALGWLGVGTAVGLVLGGLLK
jgi:uncharacterized membrane protein YgcG